MKFSELNLLDSVQNGLKDVNFEEPTPVQEKSIPVILEGKDIIATAQTGTGKTGAFVIPLLDRIKRGTGGGIKSLILTPTRELAQQIDEQIFAIGYHTGITSATVIGGSDFSVQAKALKAGVDIIVATPGRLIDQKKIVNIDFSTLDCLVLDEADRMLDMGFLPDIKKIISWLPEKRQTLLFSATMPKEIERLAAGIMNNPVSLDIARAKAPTQVEQRAYIIRSEQKIPLIKKIFKGVKWESCIIFTSTKKGTDELQRLLKQEGIKAVSIHGDRSQDERNRSLNAFKSGEYPVIVATNVIARGIDIKDVSLIVNYDVPNNTDDYIHRIGRTARYGKSGIAITFVSKRDSRLFDDIGTIDGNTIKKIVLPESFGDKSAFFWNNADKESAAGDTAGDRKKEGTAERAGAETEPNKVSGKSAGKGTAPEKRSNNRPSSGRKKREGRGKNRNKAESSGSSEKDRNSEATKSGATDNAVQNESSDKSRNVRNTKANKGRGGNGDEEKTKQTSSRSGNRTNKGNNGNAPVQNGKSAKGNPVLVDKAVIEKATERNRRTRKPAKGIWGIIKSIIPKIKPD